MAVTHLVLTSAPLGVLGDCADAGEAELLVEAHAVGSCVDNDEVVLARGLKLLEKELKEEAAAAKGGDEANFGDIWEGDAAMVGVSRAGLLLEGSAE
jgi:hypothetical protein